MAPWLSGWNHRCLQVLFQVLPHHTATDGFFQFLVFNSLLSTWIFAACFYWYWSQDDEKTSWRRQQLFQVVVAIAFAFVLTLLVRPWIRWPAPAQSSSFRDLYPRYFWDNGTLDSFPSHSTLAYFAVAAGLWSLNRALSVLLALLVLGLVSLPRIYVGGHYPIDVAASIVLAVATLEVVRQWQVRPAVACWLSRRGSGTAVREFLFIIWIFELGEGFRGSMGLLFKLKHLLPR
jgi:membrane-associated phospholipid phosphatase